MIESKFTSNIHARLDPLQVMVWKINDNYAGGVPDAFYRAVNGGANAKPLWVEYKLIKDLPKRDSTTVVPKLTAQQREWLKSARFSGEQAVVILGVENLKVNRNPASFVLHNPWEWADGRPAADFRAMEPLDYRGVAEWITAKVRPE